MAPRKSERIVNLTICLLSTKRFLPKDEIRTMVEGYRDLSDQAFERTFERDKDELRNLGVPLETGSHDKFFDDEWGYRIRRADFELPPVEFTPDELAALGAAGRVWQQATVADTTATAFAKLRAAGAEPDLERLAALEPSVSAREPSFDVLWQAVSDKTPVRFEYRGDKPLRAVEPWRLTWRRGVWYLLGLDTDKGEPRMFRLGRITSDPVVTGQPARHEVPPAEELDAHVARLEPGRPDRSAVVAIRGDRAPALRRRGEAVDPGQGYPELPEGFVCYRVPYATTAELAEQVRAAAADALVIEPAQVREAVLDGLRAVAALGAGSAS